MGYGRRKVPIIIIRIMKHIFFAAIAALALCVSCQQQAAQPSALDVIMSRYSVRSYTGEKVTEAQLETLLRAGMAAPSGMNQQPWRFVVVNDPETMDAMTPWGADTWKAAGTVIVVCGKTTMGENNDANPLWEADCAAVTENILLAAKALGLGAVWNACYPFFQDKTREALGLPEDVTPYSIVPVGVEQGSEQPKDKWDPEKIHRNKW